MNQKIACPHQHADAAGRVCDHLLSTQDGDFFKAFTGIGRYYDLLCSECAHSSAESERQLYPICRECFDFIEREGCWDGITGRPQILERQTTLHFQHETVEMPELSDEKVLDIQPINSAQESLWVALTAAGRVFRINFSQQSVSLIHSLADVTSETMPSIQPDKPLALSVAPGGDFAAIVHPFGQHGIVLDLSTGCITMRLERDDYHSGITPFPVAFFTSEGRTHLVHGTAWNRLDISDPHTGKLLSSRGLTSYGQGEERPEHYLDYFHGRLCVSPGQEWIADNGWVWHPSGGVATWNIHNWLHNNVWESEDGSSKKYLCWRDYYWDGPLCWVDEKRLAVWGYGNDDEWLIPAVRIFDVESGAEPGWFPGPETEWSEAKEWFYKPFNSLVFDTFLFSISEKHGTAAWDIETGERLLHEKTFAPKNYHHAAHEFCSIEEGNRFTLSRLRDATPETRIDLPTTS